MSILCAWPALALAEPQWDMSAASEHWIDEAPAEIRNCPGAAEPRPLKLITELDQVIFAKGVVLCTDLRTAGDPSDHYRFDVEYITVEVEQRFFRLSDFRPIRMDHFGIAVFRHRPADRAVAWLYEDAAPIALDLIPGESDRQYAFSGVSFDVPVSAFDDATRMSFYLTFGGGMIQLGAL